MGLRNKNKTPIKDRYGRWKVLKDLGVRVINTSRIHFILCRCECGLEKEVRFPDVHTGKSVQCKSCATTAKNITHGCTSNPVYSIWKNMVDRCHNENCKVYSYYGGRGIFVCDVWRYSVEKFIEDMYPTYKKGLTLERIDNNLGYFKDNCKWATMSEQLSNRRPYGKQNK